MAPHSRIKITSKLDIQSESLYEKLKDTKTGETKVIDKQEPHHWSKSTTVTTNPVKYAAEGTQEPKVQEGAAETQTTDSHDVSSTTATEGYDTSQL